MPADLRKPHFPCANPAAVRVASVTLECAWSGQARLWIMSHHVQLNPFLRGSERGGLGLVRVGLALCTCQSLGAKSLILGSASGDRIDDDDDPPV